MTRFTIARKGNFTVHARPGTPHCGLKDGTATFGYEVKLCCSEEGLDADGFVVDNAELQAAFDRIGSTGLSCENLCRAVSRYLYRRFHAEGRHEHLESVSVRIYGLPTAYAEFEWEREKRAGRRREGRKERALAAAWGGSGAAWTAPHL